MFCLWGMAVELAERLRELRERAGLKPVELAQKSGVPASTISRIEAGLIREPRRVQLVKLASALNVSLSELAVDLANGTETHVNHEADRWRKFVRHFKAGSAEEFAETFAKLPKGDQAILVRLAKLMEMGEHIG